jgi:iron complex outermembrane receptor protein
MVPLLKYLLAFNTLAVLAGSAAAAPVLDEIIVTARKRDENLARIGQAVSALTGDQLRDRGIGDLEALQLQIPNFTMGQQLGSARISLRGVGLDNISASADGSIAFHGDGVFYARPAAALGTFFDVERVEVLRGPQGTLYGRNATGGSVNVISRKPTRELSGYVTATAGNYDKYGFEGALGGPLVEDTVLGRLAVRSVDRGGFGRNIVTGNEIDDSTTRAVRGQLELIPSPDLEILLRGEYFEANDHAYGYHFINPYSDDNGFSIRPVGAEFGGVFSDHARDVANDVDSQNDRDIVTLSAVVGADLGPARLTSITGYQETTYLTQSDLDVSSAAIAPLYQSEDARQFSQELQLVRDGDSWNWLLGAYYFEERIDAYFDVPFRTDVLGVTPTFMAEGYYSGGRIDTRAYALFGELSRAFTDHLRLTLGARYSYEEKQGQDRTRFDLATPDTPDPGRVEPPILATPSDYFSAFTPRILLEHQTDDLLVYASAARGFKSGGINLGGLQAVVRPEMVTAYELGLKAGTADRRWRANLSCFYYDYSDLQVGLVRSNVLVLENAATASIYGLEAEITAAPTEYLRFDLIASYLHAEYEDFITQDQARPGRGNTIDPSTAQPAFQLAGNQLSQAPEFSVNAGTEYQWTTALGDFSLRGEIFWVDDIYFTAFNLSASMQAAHSRQNVFFNWLAPDRHWSGQIFVRNIDDGDDLSHVFVTSTLVGSPVIGSYQEPRTFGIRLTYEY